MRDHHPHTYREVLSSPPCCCCYPSPGHDGEAACGARPSGARQRENEGKGASGRARLRLSGGVNRCDIGREAEKRETVFFFDI